MANDTLNTIKAAIVPIIIKRGDATTFTIPLFDPNDSNNPVDLSVYSSFRAQIKIDSLRDTSLIELLSSSAEIAVSSNELTFIISAAKSAVKQGVYVWDVEGIGGPQDPKTLIEGPFEVSQDISR